MDPDLPKIVKEKCEAPIISIGKSAGRLCKDYQQIWGLSQDVQVSPFIIDAHSGVLGVGAIEAGEFTAVIGTSTCHLMLDSKQVPISSITGSVKNAIIPGLYAMKLVNQLSVICSNTQRTKHLNILWIKQMNIICLCLTI